MSESLKIDVHKFFEKSWLDHLFKANSLVGVVENWWENMYFFKYLIINLFEAKFLEDVQNRGNVKIHSFSYCFRNLLKYVKSKQKHLTFCNIFASLCHKDIPAKVTLILCIPFFIFMLTLFLAIVNVMCNLFATCLSFIHVLTSKLYLVWNNHCASPLV
jgi:hypothetical protein